VDFRNRFGRHGHAGSGFSVTVDDKAPIRGVVGCTGFVTRVVRGLDRSRRTPAWMIKRLALMGIRSISLPVDISNYVMMELGQPTHTYDLNKLTGGITVRRATKGEKLHDARRSKFARSPRKTFYRHRRIRSNRLGRSHGWGDD